jgi:hypothetical protein
MFVVLPNPDPVTVTLPGAGYLGVSTKFRFCAKSVQLNVSGPTIGDGSGVVEAEILVRTAAETIVENKDIFIF